jgi:N-acetylmuramoyl-L-alanine amidase
MATVVLDAGHGGYDAGAVNGDRYEKNDNLRMTLAVGELLRQKGINVIYTRTDDTYLSLAERAAVSNAANVDEFVSFHRNSATNPEANGFENYIAPNASAKSREWAQNVYNAVVESGVFPNSRGLKEANYYVLRNTKAPAMLLELGFISNAGDNERFDSDFNVLAQTIADAIAKNLGVQPTPPTPPLPPTPTHRQRVIGVQTVLNDVYKQNIAVDGIVGSATKKALRKALQMQLNANGTKPPLVVDGIWGAKTRAAVPLVRLGDRGNMVWLIQAALVAHGYNIAADGIFGQGTQNALIDFQRKNGLSADGIAGPNTFERLFN